MLEDSKEHLEGYVGEQIERGLILASRDMYIYLVRR